MTHPAVRKVVFAGFTKVGRRIMAGCAERVKRVTLELGGNNSNIVFVDAHLERAAVSAPAGALDNAGLDCCARSLVLVQRSVLDRFLELLEPAGRDFACGDPWREDSQMGPLVSDAHRDSVAGFLDDGAPVAFRSTSPDGPGWWFPSTVLTPSPDSRVFREEIAAAVAFLAGDDASFVHAATFLVDGGSSAPTSPRCGPPSRGRRPRSWATPRYG